MGVSSLRAIGLLGVFCLTAVGCSGGSPAQPAGDLPAAVGSNGGSAAVLSRGTHSLGGVRRSITGCTGVGSHSFVGGNDGNDAEATDSAVLGGQFNDACESGSSIGGGSSNNINASGGASYAFIGAGFSNGISSGYTAVIGGGYLNATNYPGSYSFIGGGYKNSVSGQYASILGGNTNTANGTQSTVAGGAANQASGYSSFAAGYHADANQAGSFVWSDSSSSNVTKPTVAYEFVARASGGVEFFSNAAMTTGVKLAAGGGSWASLSDRAVKTNIQPISDSAILDKVAAMPVTQWSYISEHGVRHVGPMAQDFYAAFGVGEDNKHITSIDEDGVALAAIKALHAQLAQTNARLAQKDAAVRELQRQVARLATRVAKLH